MRDILIMSIVLVAALAALRRPWLGVLLWVWVSLMNPHRYTFGFAYDAPVAMLAAVSTLVGLLLTPDKQSPFKAPPVAMFVALSVWVTISWLMGLDPSGEFPQWEKVMKINLMVIVALVLMKTKEHIFCLVWVLTLSIAVLSAKGGVFTVTSGGGFRVWGPPGSFVEGNNEFAVATIMAIPLLRFMQLQVKNRWLSRFLLLTMLLCTASAVGSHSRGALLAIVAMAVVLWWRGQKKFRNGALFFLIGLGMIAFMPDNWSQRMDTIETYQEDQSALGRFSAWWVSWRIAFAYPFGVGFNITRPELFQRFSPYPELGTPVAHSIWFQMLGHHGFVGFLLFVGVWLSTWRCAQGLRKAAAGNPSLRWCGDLGAMAQVSLVAYFVGGAFLQLGYYDFPYYVMAVVALVHAWVKRRAWESEPAVAQRGWRALIGLGPSVPAADLPTAAPTAPVAAPVRR